MDYFSSVYDQPGNSILDTSTVEEGIVYAEKHISTLARLPFLDMIANSATGNEKPPKIRLNGIPFEKCYILNTETINEGLMWRDNLGAWSAQNKRPSCRRYELDEDFCMTEYGGAYVLKKQYAIHPYTEPPNSLSKCLFVLKKEDFDEIEKQLQKADPFVRFILHEKGNKRIFCATRSMLAHFRVSCVQRRQSLEDLLSRIHPGKANVDPGHFTDERIAQEARNGARECYLHVTYNLGFYCTTLVFKSAVFAKINGEPAICFGAFMFSSEKSENDYRWFAYFLADAIESTVNDRVRSIVVDSEAAINQISAIPLFMSPCSHILCESHLRTKVEMLLRQCGANKKAKTEILAGIFGQEMLTEHGRERKYGLVDCISEEVFKERLEREKENWELLCSGFTKKFWSNIVGSRLVFSGYLLPARFTSGLGVGRVIANPAENTNARLKIRLQNLQCTGLHVIIHMLEERYERTRLKRCIIKNEGELELTGKYADFSVSKEEWSQMSPLQKLCAWRKICIEEGDSSEIMSSI
ncbi:unnamed protein product [Gongylonema pulchrum]|uniref:MULE domain-containing protein n=1 Tax=Gongylonema pulchrum TaxID=637853 RepID=A0A183EHX7_9BILA|nr:unnamed protein product [Gongylonema pulchrum]